MFTGLLSILELLFNRSKIVSNFSKVFTAASGASHLNFHGVTDVPEAEMFAQFSERLKDWNPSIMRAETFSLPSLLCRNFLPQRGLTGLL